MAPTRNVAPALIPIALALVAIGVAGRERFGGALGLSGDFWSGAVLGVAIGLLMTSLVLGARASRSRK